MNLNHRLAAGKGLSGVELVMYRVRGPASYLIPFVILALSWWRALEYFGEEWQVGTFSTAFFPYVTRLVSSLFSIDQSVVVSQLVLIGYVLTPLSFYVFVYALTKRHLPSALTAVLMILPLNIFSTTAPERLILALTAGDGAHILGFTFIPLVALLFFTYIRSGKISVLIGLGLVDVVLALTSFFAQFILFFVCLFITISEVLVGQGRIKFTRFGLFFAVYILVAVVIYNISLLGIIVSETGQTTLAVLANLLPLSFFLVPVLGTFAFLIFDRRPTLQPLFLALSFFVVFGLLHLVRISFVDIPILQQDRYAVEVSFGQSFLVALLITWIFDLLRAGKIIERTPQLVANKTLVAYAFVGTCILFISFSILFIPHSL